MFTWMTSNFKEHATYDGMTVSRGGTAQIYILCHMRKVSKCICTVSLSRRSVIYMQPRFVFFIEASYLYNLTTAKFLFFNLELFFVFFYMHLVASMTSDTVLARINETCRTFTYASEHPEPSQDGCYHRKNSD